MMSKEALERYRAMTPSERLAISLQMTKDSMKYLLAGPKEVVDRRFARINAENAARNRAMLEGLARVEPLDE